MHEFSVVSIARRNRNTHAWFWLVVAFSVYFVHAPSPCADTGPRFLIRVDRIERTCVNVNMEPPVLRLVTVRIRRIVLDVVPPPPSIQRRLHRGDSIGMVLSEIVMLADVGGQIVEFGFVIVVEFHHHHRDDYGIEYLGVDDIAREPAAAAHRDPMIASGRLFFERLTSHLSTGRSLIIESTLSGPGLAGSIRKFRERGFIVHLVYVFVDSVDLCRRRIAVRVSKGGHNVPDADVERRYRRSLRNFQSLYLPLADSWQVFYNGGKHSVEVAVGDASGVLVIDEEYYARFKEKLR